MLTSLCIYPTGQGHPQHLLLLHSHPVDPIALAWKREKDRSPIGPPLRKLVSCPKALTLQDARQVGFRNVILRR